MDRAADLGAAHLKSRQAAEMSERAGSLMRPDQRGAEPFQKAIFCHQRGQLSEAERYYRVMLKADERHFPSVHGLGLIRLQQGRHADAVPIFRRATKINGNSAEAYHHLAVALTGLGRPQEAIKGFERALAINPNFVEAHDSLGHALQMLGQIEDAIAHHKKAVELNPAYASAYNNLGNALQKVGRYEEAIAQYQAALRLRPIYPEAHNNLGVVLAKLRRHEAAVVHYKSALATSPNHVHAHVNLGNSLVALGDHEKAIAHYRKALASDPLHSDARICLGQALLRMDRNEEASAQCDQVLASKPATHSPLNNLATLLWKLNRRDEALACYERALAIQPDDLATLINRADTLAELGRFEEALADYARVQAMQPDHAAAHHGEAFVHLRLGDLRSGFEKYEWRQQDQRCFPKPAWRGDENVRGKTILVHAEQGLGETLQFCRYTELLAQRGAKVVLEVQPVLKQLLACLRGVDVVIATGEEWPDFDYHCPMLSLPRLLKTTLETVPANTPYIQASSDVVAKWEQRLGPRNRLRVGFAWSGNPNHPNDHNRSMPLKYLLPLFSPAVQLVSLQKEVRRRDLELLTSRDDLVHFGEELRDFSDTAAIVASMDLVISVCTSVGHLAGAMNRPTWFLLSDAVDWRWLLHRSDSPWYPSARLFRQPKLGDWNSVIQQVAVELAKLESGFR